MEKLNEQQIETALSALEGWKLENGSIGKSFTFTNFKEAFAFMTRVAFEAETQNHHPNWENVYNSVTIRLNTHDVGGITMNDISLATIIEGIVNS
ncbi:MAG: 4a-hydroxytetrahydrobiopterin dehydratase [Bacteroidota bacterium]